jgi:2-(1,2-epoxy-1,2-dihydrophenyl)acetyl-CoA isomerase
MSEYGTLLFEVRDNVAFISFNRPQAANSLNAEMGRDLMLASIRCDEDPAIRAVVLAGKGSTFSAGGDLKSFAAYGESLPAHLKGLTTYLHAAMSRFTRMDAPLIGAVHGSAAGAGLSFACACDIVYAAESAKFTMAYTRLGLTPDGSSTYFLPRIVGLRRALELAITNRMLSAREAMELGIVTTVVPDSELTAASTEMAKRLASGPTRAFGGAKRLLHSGMSETIETQMELEARSIAELAKSEDGQEGIRAFVEKRPAKFLGR